MRSISSRRGAALERAGDARAIERLEAARALDPKLVVADILLARLAVLELGAAEGAADHRSAEEEDRRSGRGPRAERAGLGGRSGSRQGPAGRQPRSPPPDREKLPSPLRAVPLIVEAVRGMEAGDHKRASTAIGSAISLSTTPALATRLGFLAIQAGDEQLARKAALRALQFAAVYPGARVLAARVALLGGRLDEAKKAIEELDPRTPEILVVRAAVAYETLDTSELASAVEAMGEGAGIEGRAVGARGRGVRARGPAATAAGKAEGDEQPVGSLGRARGGRCRARLGRSRAGPESGRAWGETARPVYLLRLARLRRYQGKLDEADSASKSALEQGTTTARSFIERVLVLVAKEDAARSARSCVAKYPTLLGPMTAWLSALVDVAAKRTGGRQRQGGAARFASGRRAAAAARAGRALAGGRRRQTRDESAARGLPQRGQAPGPDPRRGRPEVAETGGQFVVTTTPRVVVIWLLDVSRSSLVEQLFARRRRRARSRRGCRAAGSGSASVWPRS